MELSRVERLYPPIELLLITINRKRVNILKNGVYDHPLMRVEVTDERVFVYIKDPLISEVKGYCMVNYYGDSGTSFSEQEPPEPTVRVGEGELTEEEQADLEKLERGHVRGKIVKDLSSKI